MHFGTKLAQESWEGDEG